MYFTLFPNLYYTTKRSYPTTIRPNGRILLIFTILSEGSGLCPNNPQAQARLTALHPPPSGSKERVNPSPADQRATSLSVKGCNDVPSRTYRPPLTAFRCIATRFRVVQGQAQRDAVGQPWTASKPQNLFPGGASNSLLPLAPPRTGLGRARNMGQGRNPCGVWGKAPRFQADSVSCDSSGVSVITRSHLPSTKRKFACNSCILDHLPFAINHGLTS